MTHGDACQRMHTDEGARILGAMIVGTLHQSRLRINISQSHVDSHRRIKVGENLAGNCLVIKLHLIYNLLYIVYSLQFIA